MPADCAWIGAGVFRGACRGASPKELGTEVVRRKGPSDPLFCRSAGGRQRWLSPGISLAEPL